MFQGYRSKSGIAIFAYYAYSLFNLVVLDHLKKLKPFYHIIRIKGELFTSDGFKYFDRSLHNFFKIVFNFSLLILYFPCMKELGRKTFQHLLPLPFLVASLFYLCCLYIFYLYIFHQFFFNLPGSEFPVQPPVSIHILPLVDSLLEYLE